MTELFDRKRLGALKDTVAVVTLNRPEARNAIDAELGRALPEAIRRCDAIDSVRAIVLTGADPAFCAGFDLRDVTSGKKKGENVHPGYWGALPPTRVPIIGAINGAAVTGGFEIALACDLIIAAENAVFALPEVRVGLAALAGGFAQVAAPVACAAHPFHHLHQVAGDGPQPSAVGFNRAAGNRQAKAGAGRAGRCAIEPIEDPRLRVGGDPAPVIDHRDDMRSGRHGHHHVDGAPRR